jgi:transcriptional antiterminator NusG
MDWYVATTKPQCEARALSDLGMEGFAVYLPVCRVEVPVHNRRRSTMIRSFPVFNGYVFVGVNGPIDFAAVHRSEFVTGFLGADATPKPVREREVLAIMDGAKHGAFDRRFDKKNKVFTAGETVRVIEGPFTGFFGQVTSVHGKKLVHMMAEMFGQLREIKFSVDQLQKVA